MKVSKCLVFVLTFKEKLTFVKMFTTFERKITYQKMGEFIIWNDFVKSIVVVVGILCVSKRVCNLAGLIQEGVLLVCLQHCWVRCYCFALVDSFVHVVRFFILFLVKFIQNNIYLSLCNVGFVFIKMLSKFLLLAWKLLFA